MTTQATLPEIDDDTLTLIEDLPAVAKAQRAYQDALQTARLLASSNPTLSRALLDLDTYAGAMAYYQLAGGYVAGMRAAA